MIRPPDTTPTSSRAGSREDVDQHRQRRGRVPQRRRPLGPRHRTNQEDHLGLRDEGNARRRMVHGRYDARRGAPPKPAVMCIGPTGENLGRTATITHDAGHHAGQSGLRGRLGLKEEPQGRELPRYGKRFRCRPGSAHRSAHRVPAEIRLQRRRPGTRNTQPRRRRLRLHHGHPGFNGIYWNARDMISRPYGCQGCFTSCRHNFDDGVGQRHHVRGLAVLHVGRQPERPGARRRPAEQARHERFRDEHHLLLPPTSTTRWASWDRAKRSNRTSPSTSSGSWEFAEAFVRRSPTARISAPIWPKDRAGRQEVGPLGRGQRQLGTFQYPQWGYFYHYDPPRGGWSYASIMSESAASTSTGSTGTCTGCR